MKPGGRSVDLSQSLLQNGLLRHHIHIRGRVVASEGTVPNEGDGVYNFPGVRKPEWASACFVTGEPLPTETIDGDTDTLSPMPNTTGFRR